MLRNFVLETANNPGSGDVQLAGAPGGRVTFASRFANGAEVYYFLDDGTQWESGIATLTHGTPHTLARTTVIANSAGTTSHLSFTGAVRAYNEVPAERLLYLDASSNIALPGSLSVAGTGAFGDKVTIYDEAEVHGALTLLSAGGSFTSSLATPGWRKLPNGDIEQWGIGNTDGAGFGGALFPIPFPTECLCLTPTLRGATGPAPGMGITEGNATDKFGFQVWTYNAVGGTAAPFRWHAIGH